MSYQPDKNLVGFCSAPWTDCITYADGELKACDRNPVSFGNWQQNGLKNTWHSEKFQNFRRDVREGRYPDKDCASCHNNGTQRTLRSSLIGAYYMHSQFLWHHFGVPEIPEIAHLYFLLDQRARDERSDEILRQYFAGLDRLVAENPAAYTNNPEFHTALVKLRVIGETVEDYLRGDLTPRRVATFRQSQLQAKCTARCVMCAGKYTGEIVDGPTMDEKFVDEAFAEKEDITDFWCNGAEYLYYKEWRKIALMLAEQGVKLRVSTNGILLTEPTIRFMIDNKILRYLTMSLDAATKETMESTRINVNFRKNMENIRFLLKYAQEKNHEFEFTAAFVMMKRNLHELPAFVRLIHSLRPPGCKNFVTVLCQPLENFDILGYRRFVHGEHHALLGEEKLREIFTETWQAHRETGVQVSFYNQKLDEFMAAGMPFPKFFPRLSDIDLIASDLKSGARFHGVDEGLEAWLENTSNYHGGSLRSAFLRHARALFAHNAVVAEVGKEFPQLWAKVDEHLPTWIQKFESRLAEKEKLVKKALPENFCILPFTTMLVRADASVSVCCLNSSSATNQKGEPFHLYKDPLNEAFHSPFFRELREHMAAGKRHPSCATCWKEDDAGIASKRVADNQIWSQWVDKHLAGENPDSPIDISFNLGTLCNLKCRICGSTSSSRWAQEYLELFGTDHIPRNNDYIKSLSAEDSRALLSNWPLKNPEFTDTVFSWLPRMERMEFLGGEPFLNKKQFEIVAKSVEMGASKHQALHFATNGELYPEGAARDHWPHFRFVNVNISVDGLGKQFEYQRFGAHWENVLGNIARYRALDSVDLVQVYLSISVFTVYYLPEIFAFWEKQGLNVCLSTVTNPHRFDVRVLPPALKEKIRARFGELGTTLGADSRQKMESVATFMLSEDRSELWPRFIESVWYHDGYRKQSFAETFPEFHREMVDAGVWYDYATQKEFFLPTVQADAPAVAAAPALATATIAATDSSSPIPPARTKRSWLSRWIGTPLDSL